MHRKMLENFAVIAVIAMMLLSNITIAMAFNNSPLNETEKSSPLNDHSSPIAFEDLWWMGNNSTVNYENFVVDEDSMQLIVGLDYANSWACNSIGEWIARIEGKVVNTVSVDGKIIAVVADIPLKAVSSFIEQMSRNPLVRYVEPNMKRQALFEPNDPYWSLQWGPKKIEANWAWNKTRGSSDIIVAVVDSGIDYKHPDLIGNYITGGYDWVNNDKDPLDDFGHGTHCAGIIAAVINNNEGIAGLAQVKIMAEKVLDYLGYGYDDWIANGIIHAANSGAKIISMSLGGYGYSRLLHDAVKYAYGKGVLLVAAAGNDNIGLKSYPAAYDEVIAVAATDINDLKAVFSNWGNWIELAAPGVDIYSTMPTYPVTLNNYSYSMNYDFMSGTSMACPHVAGVAALVWCIYPEATSHWVRTQIRYTAKDLGDPGFDKYYGYGRIDARKAVEQEPPDHDLLVFDIDRPQYIKLKELITFNVTVQNFGKSDESNVEVRLLVNDTQVDSKTIDFLRKYMSTTINLTWTPSETGVSNVTYYIAPISGEASTENNKKTEMLYVVPPPSESKWMLLEEDPDEGVGCNLKAIHAQLSFNIIYFKVEYYRKWATIEEIDTGIPIDADQDPTTGLPDGYYPYQDTDMGADYIIVVGFEATEMWRWDPVHGWWDLSNPIPLAYLEAHENSNWFIVGIFSTDIETKGLIDCAVADPMSRWDWMPNHGHFTWLAIQHPHELAVTLKAPKRLELGKTAILNATAYNVGSNDETNVKLSIFINSSEVVSEAFNLPADSSRIVSHVWTPETEAFYNITAYVRPVSGEFTTVNNKAEKIVHVLKIKGYVLFDQTHWTDPISSYSMWVETVEDKGYIVEVLTTAPINKSELEGYDIFVIPQARYYYTSDELDAIRKFVLDGGGLLVIGDDCPDIYTELTNFAGISWGYGGYGGYTSDITPHPVTEGVKLAFFGGPSSSLIVSSSALGLIKDRGGYVMLAVSEIGKGAVICIADEDSISNYVISYADNLRLAKNMIDWLANRPPKVFVVYSPLDPYVGETIIFNASASYDPDGTIVDYVWDFGDGTIQHAGAVISHIYAKGGTYTVSCTAIDNEGLNSTLKLDITVQRTTLNVQVKVGAVHFAGEMAEFYILTSSLGELVNAEVSAQLYFNGSLYADLSDAIETISQGFYRVPYTIPGNASTGTYTLIVKAKYYSLSGVSIESFQLSRTLSGWNAQIQEIRDDIATFVIPDLGAIRLNLTAINMTLQDIFLKVIAINGATARIETTLGIVNGTVTEIKGNMATVIVPGLGQVQTDVSNLIENVSNLIEKQETWTMPQYLVMAFSIVAAAGAVLSASLLLRQRKLAKG
jgi:thermitase